MCVCVFLLYLPCHIYIYIWWHFVVLLLMNNFPFFCSLLSTTYQYSRQLSGVFSYHFHAIHPVLITFQPIHITHTNTQTHMEQFKCGNDVALLQEKISASIYISTLTIVSHSTFCKRQIANIPSTRTSKQYFPLNIIYVCVSRCRYVSFACLLQNYKRK